MQPLHLFIYGTLMRGQDNHGWMGDAVWLGDVQTEPCYSLYKTTLGPYPGLRAAGTTAVHGELYAVTAGRRTILDDFEDHPQLYERRPVALAGLGGVEAYFLVHAEHTAELLVTGDWRHRQPPRHS